MDQRTIFLAADIKVLDSLIAVFMAKAGEIAAPAHFQEYAWLKVKPAQMRWA